MKYRAFLSHSSFDKDFVDLVFEELERVSVIYDKYEFLEGEQFSAAIASRMMESGIFVLFASQAALKSPWVHLESDTAESLVQAGALNHTLVFLLGDATHKMLPPWLQTIKAISVSSPLQAAVAIRERQTELIDLTQNPIFVNRFAELNAAEVSLMGRAESPTAARRSLVFYGRAGFGRHILARKVFANAAGLRKHYVVPLEPADELPELAIKLAQFSETYRSRDELQAIIDSLVSSSAIELNAAITQYISTLASQGSLIILEDAGGLSNNDGSARAYVASFVRLIEQLAGSYCGIIAKRKVIVSTGVDLTNIRVFALGDEHAENIFRRYAEELNLRLEDHTINELVSFIGGHPPSLRYAAELIKERGIEAVLYNRKVLVEHNLERYWTDIRSDRQLLKEHKAMLVALAYYGPMPLRVLAKVVGLERADIAARIIYLLDTVLVQVDNFGHYTLPTPLIEVATWLFPDVAVNHDAAFDSIDHFLNTHPETSNRLALERARGRALSLGSRPGKDVQVIQLASDLLRSAELAYRNERYQEARDYAELTLKRRATNEAAIHVFVQSLVKLSRLVEARAFVDERRIDLPAREVHYLQGFIERGGDEYSEAIKHYTKALEYGSSLALHRELAFCYFHTAEISKAMGHIQEAKKFAHGRENAHVLALELRIAIFNDDEKSARSVLELCRRNDRFHHYLFLAAAVELAFARPADAFIVLDRAKRILGRDRFPALYLRACANIIDGNIEQAWRIIQKVNAKDRADYVALVAATLWRDGRSREAVDEIHRASDPLVLGEIKGLVQSLLPNDSGALRKLAILLINQQSGLYSDVLVSEQGDTDLGD